MGLGLAQIGYGYLPRKMEHGEGWGTTLPLTQLLDRKCNGFDKATTIIRSRSRN